MKRNLVANLFGTVWFGVTTVALVPVYLALLGPDGFGLVAFQTTLAAVVALLDLGLAVTTNREMARLSAAPGGPSGARVFARTTEAVYWTIALAAGTALVALTPLIAGRWLNTEQMPQGEAAQAIALASIGVALQFPYAFYAAGLLGLQRHVTLNAILIGGTTLRAAGSIALLLFVARDVRLLFAWHALTALLQTGAAAVALWKALPAGTTRFDRSVLGGAWRFARGIALSATLGAVTTQVDKLAVSKLLPLTTFGYYSIAWMVAAAVALIVTPVQTTVFPRLSQHVARGDSDAIRAEYHRASQVVAAILLPMTAMATLFAYELVLLWTGDREIASSARWLVVLLVCGAALNALSHISHSVQLAHGWTTPTVIANAVQLVVMIPLSIYAVRRFGAVGAAAAWAFLQSSFLVISLTVTHSRTLKGDARLWLLRDVGPPLLASFAVAALGRLVIGEASRIALTLSIAALGGIVLLAGAISAPVVRVWLTERWRLRGWPRRQQ